MEENETRVEENISETTVLALPSSVVSFYVPNKDRTVIVADTLGNWLVVKPKMKHIYDKLASGKTIGEVLKGLSPSEQQDCIALLSQIYARSFFSISQEVATTSSTQESVFFF